MVSFNFDAFHDLTPITQDEGPSTVCSIDYDEEFIIAMDYMRAILQLNELSERALKLSELCLKHNPANYTLWHYRRQCIARLSAAKRCTENSTAPLDESLILYDLTLSANLGGPKPKNYQIWYHRRMLLQSVLSQSSNHIPSLRHSIHWAKEELQYITQVLQEDEKNYHAWSHRQFILHTINDNTLWEEERHYVHGLIAQDVFNNSAWNQKWFVSHRGLNHSPLSSQDAQDDIDFALGSAALDPTNESPWRYLIGILKEQIKVDTGLTLLESSLTKIREMQTVIAQELGLEALSFVHMTCALIDILECRGHNQDCIQAADLAHALGTDYDTTRTKYWLQREGQLRRKVPCAEK